MDSIWEGLFKLTLWIFKPIFKGIAWIFASIFKTIGEAIGGLIVRKGREVAPKVVASVGAGVVAAGATAVAEQAQKNKTYKPKNKKEKKKVIYDIAKNSVIVGDEVVPVQEMRTYKKETSDGMNLKQMKLLLGTKDERFVNDALEYWDSLEKADSQEFAKVKTSLWT